MKRQSHQFNRALKSKIAAAGLRAQDVARMIGVSRQVMTNWMTNLRPAPPHHRAAIAEILGAPEDVLFGDEGQSW